MDNKQFADKLQQRLPMDKKTVVALMSFTVEIIKEKAVAMDTIAIQGFGAFESRKKAERISVNPSSGKRMLIPPKIVFTFKPSTIIKNRLKELPGDE